MIVQEKETDELRRRLQEAEAALQDRCIRLEKAGNLAEADEFGSTA